MLIPENKLKGVAVGDGVNATGYKSFRFNDDNNEGASLVFTSGNFKLDIRERKNLLKLKEALDFALEIEEEDNNE